MNQRRAEQRQGQGVRSRPAAEGLARDLGKVVLVIQYPHRHAHRGVGKPRPLDRYVLGGVALAVERYFVAVVGEQQRTVLASFRE